MTAALAVARDRGATRAVLLLGGLWAAVWTRTAAGATRPAVGLVFAAALLLLAGRWPQTQGGTLRTVGLGLAGVVVLCAVPLAARLGSAPTLRPPGAGALLVWSVATVAIAVAEEALLRGALLDAVCRACGGGAPESAGGTAAAAAVLVAAVAFAVIHLPLYGATALPVDLGVGVLLGCLRVAGGGVPAPAIAHAGADLCVWWVW